MRRPPAPEKSPSSRLFFRVWFRSGRGGADDVERAGGRGAFGGAPGGRAGPTLQAGEGDARGFREVVPPLPDFAHANLHPRASAEGEVRLLQSLSSSIIPLFAYGDPPTRLIFSSFYLNCEGTVNFTSFTY